MLWTTIAKFNAEIFLVGLGQAVGSIRLGGQVIFKKKWANPSLSLFIYDLFQTNKTILQQINVKNDHPVYGAGIQTHDLSNMSRQP